MSSPTSTQIESSRIRLENPYAYLGPNGRYSASLNQESAKAGPSESVAFLTDAQIEKSARDTQIQLWREKDKLWSDNPPSDPIEVLDPAKALFMHGYSLIEKDALGQLPGTKGKIEVAGLIDQKKRTVNVSRQFPDTTRLFTAAHELGHAVLHPGATGLHRDRPLDGGQLSREPREFQADKYSSYFLMPSKLILLHFKKRFLTNNFALTDETAFALAAQSIDEVLAEHPDRRSLARFIAKTDTYNQRRFRSLANTFRVSVEAMAIRLEELKLV